MTSKTHFAFAGDFLENIWNNSLELIKEILQEKKVDISTLYDNDKRNAFFYASFIKDDKK